MTRHSNTRVLIGRPPVLNVYQLETCASGGIVRSEKVVKASRDRRTRRKRQQTLAGVEAGIRIDWRLRPQSEFSVVSRRRECLELISFTGAGQYRQSCIETHPSDGGTFIVKIYSRGSLQRQDRSVLEKHFREVESGSRKCVGGYGV
jgi:hypothetical protein